MRFSICIPNYNYETYVGKAIESALAQTVDLEVCVSDNASLDQSVAVIRGISDERVRLHVNRRNVGFAANVDKAVAMASGDWILVLSSDDLILPGALELYQRILDELPDAATIMLTAATSIIDSAGETTGSRRPHTWAWAGVREDAALSSIAGVPVLDASPLDLLSKSLQLVRNPVFFVSTAYPRTLWSAVEGYGGQSLISPDKVFHWKMLGIVTRVLFVDQALFAYRRHSRNQAALQRSTGSLKHLVDQYVYTITVDDCLLEQARMTRGEFVRSFVEQDVVIRAVDAIADGDRVQARRIVNFGLAVYPQEVARSRNAAILRTLLAAGPLGTQAARHVRAHWRRRRSVNLRL